MSRYKEISSKLSRRRFIKASAALLPLMSVHRSSHAQAHRYKNSASERHSNDKIENLARLFCTAYITPDAPGQGGQEHIVAKYPLIIVPQDNRNHFVKWRNKVREINPDIVILAYQMVIEETTVPGPGHDILRTINKSWSHYPGGYIPKVGPSHKRRRIFDPRTEEWKSSFVSACHSTLESYDYDGLFLDQCTIFPKSSPFSSVRSEMEISLQNVLKNLRSEFPNMLLVGNCRNSWIGLNGEMNEARRGDIVKELAYFEGHSLPRVELIQSRVKSISNKKEIITDMKLAHQYDAFYGVAINYQHAVWIDEFDDVLTQSK